MHYVQRIECEPALLNKADDDIIADKDNDNEVVYELIENCGTRKFCSRTSGFTDTL